MGRINSQNDGKKRIDDAPRQRRDVTQKLERNPLDEMEVTGNTETDDANETETVISRIEQKGREVEEVMGNGYWLALVFVSPSQREEFLDKSGWRNMEHACNLYWDGLAVAKSMGIELTPKPLPFRERRADAKLVDACGLIEEVDG